MRERRRTVGFAACLAFGVALWLMPPVLVPQGGDAHAGMFDKDEDINADARRLSRDLADDSRPQRVAGLFGPSDEEKAAEEAARQRENSQDASIQSLNQRVQDLENSLQRLTGQNEQLGHQVQQLRTALDRAQKDFDYRLCTLSAQQLGATEEGEGGLDCGALITQAGAAPPPAQRGTSSGGTARQLAPPPGLLGTLNPGDINASGRYNKPATEPPRQLATIDTSAEYNAAMGLLARARYDEARSAFRAFADNHPDDGLAPQAIYWVGDIDYVQKDYTSAAHAFAEQIKKYPQSSRAPDSMLKLGQSLIAMGQKQEGCTTLAAIKSKYPQASESILAKAKEARKAASCR